MGEGDSTLSCHHPRKRMIQYMAAPAIFSDGDVCWIPAFAGMTDKAHSALQNSTGLLPDFALALSRHAGNAAGNKQSKNIRE